MKKLVIRLTLLGLVLFIALAIAIGVSVKPAARTAVEFGGTTALGVPTTLGGVQLGLGLGRSKVGLEDLVVQNPKGFDGPAFLDLGEASVEVDTMSLLGDTVRVPRINLTGLKLRVVQNGKHSNLVPIVQHLRQQLEGGAAAEPAGSEDAGGSGKGLAVDLIHIAGVEAEFDLRGVPGIAEVYHFKVPDFDVDLTEEGQATRKRKAEELIAEVVDELVKKSFLAANTEVPAEVTALLQGGLSFDSIVDQAQSMLGTKVDEEKQKLETKLDDEKQKLESIVEEEKQKLETKAGDKLKEALGGKLPKKAPDGGR